jgi:putative membrane protein
LGIYEELIQSIREIAHPPVIRAALKFKVKELLELVNWKFLVAVAVGVLLSILTLSSLLENLLENQPVYLWSFFFGLVLASVYTVGKTIKSWTPVFIGAAILAAIGAYLLVGLVPAQTPDTYLFLFISGALAICAMILPGISGAFILVLLGKYQFVLSAVNTRDFVSLFFVAMGAGIGIISFAQLIGWLFKKYHDLTIAVLTGLMLGSLRKIWPWKEVVEYVMDNAGNFVLDSHGEKLVALENNILPNLATDGVQTVYALLLMLAGFGAVMVLNRIADQ